MSVERRAYMSDGFLEFERLKGHHLISLFVLFFLQEVALRYVLK